MPHVLHLIRDPGQRTALEVLAHQARDPGIRLTVVLLHEARALTESLPGEIYRLEETPDGGPASPSPYPAIGHDRLLDLVFAADTVVVW